MTFAMVLKQQRREGVEEGRAETAMALIKKGLPMDLIAECTKLSLETLKKVGKAGTAAMTFAMELKQQRREGVEEGQAERSMEIARSMLKNGVAMDLIEKYTGLSLQILQKSAKQEQAR